MSVTKKKRISKRNKSAWRKTDIKDVEDFLEEQRQEERVGSFDVKKDDELFMIDTGSVPLKRTILTQPEKRKLNALKPFRSLDALRNTSKVEDPIRKRNIVKQKKSGRNIEEEILNPTKGRHIQANKDRERYYEKLDQKPEKESKFAKDIWESKDFRDKYPGLKDEKGWITKDLSLYVVKNMSREPLVKVHDSVRHRTTKAKNFETPDPGISYNPSIKDHQTLINKVVEREEKIIKEEQHLKRVTTKMFSKVTPEEREERRLQEMSAGLNESEDEVDEDIKPNINGNVEVGSTATNPPVENKKKSKQSRRKELQQKQLQKKQAEKKALKKQIADLNRIKSIKNEVLVEEAELKNLKKKRKKVALKKKFEPKRLGRLKYVEPDTDVNMAQDIAGNLRNVKPESSLLIDRFKNFQKRNILPTSVATGKQKAKKIKRFTRSSHKEPGISFDMLRQQRKGLKA